MKTKLTGLAVSAIGAATLVLGGAATASAATVPAHASVVSAQASAVSPSVVHPAGSWYYYNTYPSLDDCITEQVELAWFGAYGGYKCVAVTGGAYIYYALYVYF